MNNNKIENKENLLIQEELKLKTKLIMILSFLIGVMGVSFIWLIIVFIMILGLVAPKYGFVNYLSKNINNNNLSYTLSLESPKKL